MPCFVYFSMAKLDLILLLVFGFIAAISLTTGYLCLRNALTAARAKDGEIRMFFWTAGLLASLTLSGLSAGYFLIPLIFGR